MFTISDFAAKANVRTSCSNPTPSKLAAIMRLPGLQ